LGSSSSIDDDSRETITEERSLSDPCEQLVNSESGGTIDPWVNYLDSGVSSNRGLDVGSGATGLAVDEGPVGLYGSESDTHDRDNDPTADTYTTEGKVGIFTDKNDDGDYDQVLGGSDSVDGFGEAVYQEDNIRTTGAYPMLWDMHAFEEGGEAKVDTERGCAIFPDDEISQVMKNAGYGPNTGLVQAVYLSEPTVFTRASSTNQNPQVYGGNNIYLLFSDAARTLWDGELFDGSDTHDLGEEVDGLVEDLRAHVSAEQDANPDTLGVEVPGDAYNFDSDYIDQCGQSTGGYESKLSFTHACDAGCKGDTIATLYAFEVTRADGKIGSDELPYFTVNGTQHSFGEGMHTWHDIDAFDGDETRNEQHKAAPPSDE
jgi:hypothetical protein